MNITNKSFVSFNGLEKLDVGHNKLTDPPPSLYDLEGLKELNLSFNEISDFLVSLLEFPSHFKVDLTGCTLSQNALEALKKGMKGHFYLGPIISYSMSDSNT